VTVAIDAWKITNSRPDVVIVDVHTLYIEYPDYDTVLMQGDGVHSTDLGYQLWGDLIYSTFGISEGGDSGFGKSKFGFSKHGTKRFGIN